MNITESKQLNDHVLQTAMYTSTARNTVQSTIVNFTCIDYFISLLIFSQGIVNKRVIFISLSSWYWIDSVPSKKKKMNIDTANEKVSILNYPVCFTVAGPKTWNALLEDVTSSQSEYTFHRQLKTTSLFKKSFPEIII